MSAAESSRDVRALKLAVALYAVIFVAKLATFQLTGVMSLFAEAFHTLSDIFIAGFLPVAALYSARRADERYMFGYGRAQNVGALVAAILFMSFTAYKLYEDAIPRLFASEPAKYRGGDEAALDFDVPDSAARVRSLSSPTSARSGLNATCRAKTGLPFHAPGVGRPDPPGIGVTAA